MPLVVLGTTEFSAEIADVIGDTGDFEITAFVENDVPARAGQTLHGLPVMWIDEAVGLAATHLAVCGLGTTRRSRARRIATAALLQPPPRLAGDAERDSVQPRHPRKGAPAGLGVGGAGIGRFQLFVNSMAITMGGHVRVGLEDNLWLDTHKERPASNIELVERLVRIARAAEREIATPDQTRAMIGLAVRKPLGLAV